MFAWPTELLQARSILWSGLNLQAAFAVSLLKADDRRVHSSGRLVANTQSMIFATNTPNSGFVFVLKPKMKNNILLNRNLNFTVLPFCGFVHQRMFCLLNHQLKSLVLALNPKRIFCVCAELRTPHLRHSALTKPQDGASFWAETNVRLGFLLTLNQGLCCCQTMPNPKARLRSWLFRFLDPTVKFTIGFLQVRFFAFCLSTPEFRGGRLPNQKGRSASTPYPPPPFHTPSPLLLPTPCPQAYALPLE